MIINIIVVDNYIGFFRSFGSVGEEEEEEEEEVENHFIGSL